jgi:cell wall-associated NlpC family hydrolase
MEAAARRSVTRARAAAGVALLLAGFVLVNRPEAGAQPPPPGQIEAGVAPGRPVQDTRPGEAFADPKVAQLQRTAADVQRELGDLANQIHTAESELLKATGKVNLAKGEREAADKVVAAQQREVDAYSAAIYSAMAQPSEVQVLLTATSPRNFLDGSELVQRLRADLNDRLAAATARQQGAIEAERGALDAERAAGARKVDLDRRNGDATNRAAAVSSELRGFLADTNAAVIAQQRTQQDRNTATAANWHAYLDRLAALGIVPPHAAALRDLARLPAGLQAVLGSAGPQSGIAQVLLPSGEHVLVLPAETIKAVSAAVDALGKPYVPGTGGGSEGQGGGENTGGEGPAAFSCDGLVHAAYAGAGIALPTSAPDQLAVLTPVAPADAQPGDLAFIGPARYGVQSVGILLDQRTMLTADARLAGVVVTDLPGGDTLLAIARPALPTHPPQVVPQPTDGGLRWRCGGVELPPRGPGEAAGAWGGYPNGFIPLTALCGIGIAGHALRCDAASSFQAMSSAFGSSFGRSLCVTDSYRAFDSQVRLYGLKPALAAIPGTSNHGWGLAVDLCGGAESFGSPEYLWLARYGPSFGWSNPPWAQPGRGREEPWHWEFVGTVRL